MSNPYIKESGWSYESGLYRENESDPWRFYVDHPHGVNVYDATPQGLHDALSKNITTGYVPDDMDDAHACALFTEEIVQSYLMAVADNAKERNQAKAA